MRQVENEPALRNFSYQLQNIKNQFGNTIGTKKINEQLKEKQIFFIIN